MRSSFRKTRVVLLAVLLLFVLALAGCGAGTDAVDTDEPVDSGRQVVETKCSLCHSIDRVWNADHTAEGWIGVVQRMKSHGMVITAEEQAIILDYLTSQ